MADNSGISFEINAKIDKALKQLDELGASIDKIGKEADKAGDEIDDAFDGSSKVIDKTDKAAEGLSSTFQKLGTVASGVFTAQQFAQYAKAIIDVRANIESLQVSFRTLLGDEQKAAELFGQIKDYAVSTPMQMADLADGAKTMLGFGIETEKVMGYLKQLGDISMGDSQKFQSLTLAFSQATSAGKLQGQDLLQLINAGFNPLNEIAKKTGKSIGELKDDMSKGAISAQDLADALASATGEGGMFHNALLDQSQTINGALSNLKGAWDDMLNDMGEGSQDVFVGIVSNITEALKHYRAYLSVIASLASAYGTYKAALMAYTVAQNAATIAQNAFNVAAKANPYVLIISAVVGLGTALYTLTDAFTDNKEELEKQNKELEEAAEKEKEYGEKAKENVKIATSAYVTTKQRKESLEKLKKAYPSIFEKYNEESIMLANIRDLLKEINEEEAKRARQPYQTGVTDSKAKYLEALKNYNKIKGEADKDRVKKGKYDYTDKQKEAIQAAKKELNDAYDAWFSAENELRKYDNAEKAAKSEINKQKKSANSEVFEAKLKAYNAAKAKFDDVVKDAREGTQKYTVEQAEAIKEDYENAKKEYEDTIGYQPESATSKSNNAATKAAREAAKAFKEKEKAKKEYANALVELEKDASQAEVDAQKEGAEKSLAQIKLDYENRKNEIAKRQKELIEQKKTAGQGDSLNEQETGFFDSLTKANEAAYKKNLNSVKDAEKQAQREYLEQYGSYMQQKLAITQRFTNQMKDADEWEKKSLQKQMEEALSGIDFEKLKTKINWEALFGNLEGQTKETLVKIRAEIVKYSKSSQFKNANETDKKTISEAIDNLHKAISEKSSIFSSVRDAVENRKEALKELEKAELELAQAEYNYKITQQLGSASQQAAAGNALKAAEKNRNAAEQNLQNAESNLQTVGDQAANSVMNVANALADLGSNADGVSMAKVGQLISSVMTAIGGQNSGLSKAGSFIGAAYALDEQVAKVGIEKFTKNIVQQIGESFIHSWNFGDWMGLRSNVEDCQKAIDEANTKNTILAQSLDKLNSTISKSTLNNIDKYATEAKELTKQQMKNASDAMISEASKHGTNRSSLNYSVNDNKDWIVAMRKVSAILGKTVQTSQDFLKLSAQEMAQIRDYDQGKTLNSILSEYRSEGGTGGRSTELPDMILSYIDEYESLFDEIDDAINESLTAVSFDSLESDFLSTLKEMDNDTDEFGEKIEETLRDAVINGVMKNYSPQLDAWYKDFSEKMKNGLTNDEAYILRASYQEISNAAVAERNEILKTLGLDSESTKISASQRSVASMSEDTASELNGRFTALQISGNSIDTNLKLLALELKNDAKETHSYLKKIVSETEDFNDTQSDEPNVNVNVEAPQVNVNVEPNINVEPTQVTVETDTTELNNIIQQVNSAITSLALSAGNNTSILTSINSTMESAVSAITSVQMSISEGNTMLANINASVLACNGTLNAIYNTNDSGFRTLQQEIRAVASAINNKL